MGEVIKILWCTVLFFVPIFMMYCMFDFKFGNTIKKVKFPRFEAEKEIDNSKKKKKNKKGTKKKK